MRMICYLLIMVAILTACDSTGSSGSNVEGNTAGNLRPVTGRDLQIVTGQLLYVPAYSEVFHGSRDETLQLSITLTIHNTDLEHHIIVQAVRYYDSDGVLITDYVEQPVEVGPLATIGFIVSENDRRGGFGANFIVEWVGEQPVHEPIVEAIMISTRSTQGISMISEGRILSQTSNEISATPSGE